MVAAALARSPVRTLAASLPPQQREEDEEVVDEEENEDRDLGDMLLEAVEEDDAMAYHPPHVFPALPEQDPSMGDLRAEEGLFEVRVHYILVERDSMARQHTQSHHLYTLPSQHSQAAAAARLPPPLAAQLPAARSIKGLQQQVAGLHDEVVKRVAVELSLYKCNKALRCVRW